MSHTFSVPGEAKPWHPPKVVYRKNAGRPIAIADTTTVDYKNRVQVYATQSGVPFIQEGPVALTIRFVRQYPKTMSGKKREYAQPVTRPDWDNLSKAVCDALNGVAYRDDSQLVDVHVSKSYGDEPKTVITLSSAL
jgi:Holliday junction resolvase RusA-like endonuclease